MVDELLDWFLHGVGHPLTTWYSTVGVSPESTVGQSFFELGNHRWDIPKLRTLLAEILPRENVLNDFEIEHDFKALGSRILPLNARAIHGDDRADLILLAIEDITERKHARQTLREREARKQSEEQPRQRQAELAHALRLSTIGEMASNLAHLAAQTRKDRA